MVKFLVHAESLGLLEGEYAFVTIEFELPSGTNSSWYSLDEHNVNGKNIFDGNLLGPKSTDL